MLSLGLVVALVVLSSTVGIRSFEPERVVVVPPQINTSFWLEKETVSSNYYREWGHYIAMLLLNVTPESVEMQNEMLLRHVSASHRAQLRAQLDDAAALLREQRLSTFFNVTDVQVDAESSVVAFAGSLASYVEGRLVEERDAAYMAGFDVRNGSLRLQRFVETNPEKIFEPLGGDARS